MCGYYKLATLETRHSLKIRRQFQLPCCRKTVLRFVEEIERASLQYLSDRLSIPTADLNKDTITATLRSKAIDESLIERTNNVLSDAAFARYAPAMGITPEQLYKQTESLINDLEDCKL